jgi:hypothetical protein
VLGDAATYWAFECLVNDRGSFGAAELAGFTGLPKAALAAGLRTLAAHKLAKRAAGGKYRSPLAGKFYMFPRAFPGIGAWQTKLKRYLDEMTARRGAVLHDSGMMIRAEEGAVHRAAAALRDALENATAYSVYEKAEGSGVFHLRVQVRKTLAF